MGKFARRMQKLSQKAAQLKHVVEVAPEHAAQLRESVLLTAGQLQQLRGEVQSSFAGVYVDSEDRLAKVVQEVNDSERIFTDIGYELVGVDIEFSPVQRVIIRLEKVEEVSLPRIRSVFGSVQDKRTTQALLSSILKAEELAARVIFKNLEYSGLVVHVGAAPAVRVCWSTPAQTQIEETPIKTPPVISTSSPSLPAFAESGFFASRSVPSSFAPATGAQSTTVQAAPQQQVSPPPSQSTPTPQESASIGWGRNALEKFKTVPGYSKYRSALRKS